MQAKKSIFESGKIWPLAIIFATMIIIAASILTVVVAQTRPVSESDQYMLDYHNADANINKIIEAQIAFDKKYGIKYLTKAFTTDKAELIYSLTNKQSEVVKDAQLEAIITRPNVHDYDIRLKDVTFDGKNYIFNSVKLPKEGRWNVMLKITVGDDYRFYNLKADTRYDTVFEY